MYRWKNLKVERINIIVVNGDKCLFQYPDSKNINNS